MAFSTGPVCAPIAETLDDAETTGLAPTGEGTAALSVTGFGDSEAGEPFVSRWSTVLELDARLADPPEDSPTVRAAVPGVGMGKTEVEA